MNSALTSLFVNRFGEEPHLVAPLKAHASNREIYRLSSAHRTVIGVVNPVARENRAFVEFTRHFRAAGLAVPEIFAEDPEQGCYLEEDLGDVTLFDLLTRERELHPELGPQEFPPVVEAIYEQVVAELPRFQIAAGRTLNYDLCYPVSSYDRSSMIWDMRYFRDNFLRRTGTSWSHQALESDFERFADFLSEAPSSHFMYRDFQSRNIMVVNGKPYFIDYQSGRRGPLQYDMASLLFQSRANIPAAARERLLNCYLEHAQRYQTIDRPQFLRYFYGFVLIRLMQVLGTYGDKGLGEKREYFLKSIPFAISNLASLLTTSPLPFHLPALTAVFESLVKSFAAGGENAVHKRPLRLSIFSFSYRTGVPRQSSDHGGGFIFDCRCLPNPGRDPAYRDRSGLDADVIDYFRGRPEVSSFFDNVFGLIDQAIESYLARGYVSLIVGFGCTGGQHRSVYCSERLAQHVKERFNLESDIRHLQMEQGFFPRKELDRR